MTLRLYVHGEEPSMQEAIAALLPMLLEHQDVEHTIIDHGSKYLLLRNLPKRLRGYALRHAEDIRVAALLDRDQDNCHVLKSRLEEAARIAGLRTKTNPGPGGTFRVLNRIVIEELKAWFLGDVAVLAAAFDRINPNLAAKAGLGDPDAVAGGTWEALHREFRRVEYYPGAERLPKIEVARRVAAQMLPARNRSRSFQAFVSGLHALLERPTGVFDAN